MEVYPYFKNVLPEAWCKPGFMEAGNPGYRWLANVLLIEKSVETYGPVEVARATTILDEDAYTSYFHVYEPQKWKKAHFSRTTGRSSAWEWALDRVIGELSHDQEAQSAALRCKDEKVQSPSSLPFPHSFTFCPLPRFASILIFSSTLFSFPLASVPPPLSSALNFPIILRFLCPHGDLFSQVRGRHMAHPCCIAATPCCSPLDYLLGLMVDHQSSPSTR